MTPLLTFIFDLLHPFMGSGDNAIDGARWITLVASLSIAALLYLASAKWLWPILSKSVRGTKNTWDDVLLDSGLLRRIVLIVPLVAVNALTAGLFPDNTAAAAALKIGIDVATILIGLALLDGVLNAALCAYDRFSENPHLPIKGVVQAVKLLASLTALILVLSLLLGKNPAVFISGLGALTAVLMLIFRDAILGFVAGIQLSAMDMIKVGDWIEMPKFGADGDVIDVSLTTVKVQNWDKTITCIPTYALISESFKNWRGMKESGGRRIKRAIYIDMTTIRFCDRDMLDRYAKIRHIAEYITRKRDELTEHNRRQGIDGEVDLVNARRLTNVGTFRAYVEAYLRAHPKVHPDLTFLIRQLAPCEHGLPLEIYVFTNDTVWANYEGIQADIFDHILAIVPEFDLRVYQQPSGMDVRALTDHVPK